jgi:hypothetical protein
VPRTVPADPPRLTKEKFTVAVCGDDPGSALYAMFEPWVKRCGCSNEFCPGWQLVHPNRPALYPVPPED